MEIKEKITFPHNPTNILLNRLEINIYVLKFNIFRRQIFKSWAISNGLRAETDRPGGQKVCGIWKCDRLPPVAC
jgi:hypothetical protein